MSEDHGMSREAEEPNDVTTTTEEQITAESVKTSDDAKEQIRTRSSNDRAHGDNQSMQDAEEDSEAETLIQSPEKKRNIVDGAPILQPSQGITSTTVLSASPKGDVQSRKRKRSINGSNANHSSPAHSRRSSLTSSVAGNGQSDEDESDRSHSKRSRKLDRTRRRRNETREQSVGSESNSTTTGNRKRKLSDAAAGQSAKKEKHGTDNAERRETRSATYPRHSDDERSPSPQTIGKREHKRGVSTQLTTHELERKRRGRPPGISTKRHRSVERTRSPDSEGSNSPAPQRSSLNKFASHDNDTMSPIKTGPKKRRDKNGRTPVARHANSGNLDLVKTELAEHREDLNLADNAGNTPLQIAALEGHIDIVEYLLSQGCEVDSRNIDKDTPLIDAVENGHVEVVKLLLDHGANPRVGNAKGDEPYELVPDDDENYEEIRQLLAEAKNRQSNRLRGQDQNDGNQKDGNSSRAASAASPRDSPPVGPRSPPAFSSRRRTGRSESTRNDLLWQAHNQPTLAKLAARGDVQGVANILNILQKAETESLIAAAKAGHEEVLQHLLAMGDPDPDPAPVKTLPPGYNTPLLAAIGRGHVDVVKLLINQSGFDPTRRLYGRYYYELAKERKGADWQHEYETLKSAFDRYPSTKGRKQTSPRKTRDLEKLKQRGPRRSASPSTTKRTSSSPTLTHKSLPSKSVDSSPKEKRKLSGHRTDNPESSVAVASDLEQNLAGQRKGHRPRRSQSDLPLPKAIENEGSYRRRRLVTGKEHRRNRSSANGSESEEGEPADMIEVKQEDRPPQNLKRSRISQSPEPSAFDNSDKVRPGPKKRKTIGSSPETSREPPSQSSSPVDRRKSSSVGEKIAGSAITEAAETPQDTMKDNSSASPPDNVKVEDSLHSDKVAQKGDVVDGTQIAEERTVDDVAEAGEANENGNDADLRKDDTDANRFDNPATGVSESDPEASAASGRDVDNSQNQEVSNAAKEAETSAAQQEAAALAEKEHQAAKKRAEEEALQAKKKAEELDAKRRLEEEAARKKEEERQEQKRREIEQRRRQQDLEIERKRLAKLPAALRKTATLLNDNDPMARDEHWLREKFLPLFTVTTRQLDPQCSEAIAEDQWIPNYQVAGLLATKDLNLRAYTSIEKRPASLHERSRLWGVSRIQLSFDYLMNWGMGISHHESNQRERENREKFMTMDDIFWVKFLDFNDQVPRYPHLTSIKLQTQAISLKTWNDVLSDAPANRTPNPTSKLTNGVHLLNPTISNSVS